MLVKVCGMRERANIKEVLRCKPDYLGFILYPPSPRGIDDATFVTLMHDLADEAVTKRIAVVVDRPIDDLVSLAEKAPFHGFQLHGDESPGYCLALTERLPEIEITKAVGVREEADLMPLADYAGKVKRILLDTKTPQRGGSGKVFDWELVRQHYSVNVPFFLSGGLGPHNISTALKAMAGLPCEGLDLNSKIEREPGVKDLQLLDKAVLTIREFTYDK